MDDKAMADYINRTFANVETTENFGYTFFFYGADHMLPFATLIASDTEYDKVSNLDRPGVFRLNLGVSRQTFQAMFGPDPVEVSRYDYTALDTFMPHPDYSVQSFICILSPSQATFETLKLLLAEAYDIARKRNSRRAAA